MFKLLFCVSFYTFFLSSNLNAVPSLEEVCSAHRTFIQNSSKRCLEKNKIFSESPEINALAFMLSYDPSNTKKFFSALRSVFDEENKKKEKIAKPKQNVEKNLNILHQTRRELSVALQKNHIMMAPMYIFQFGNAEIDYFQCRIQQLEVNISRDLEEIQKIEDEYKKRYDQFTLDSKENKVCRMLALLKQPEVVLMLNFPFAKSENKKRVIEEGTLDLADLLNLETVCELQKGMEHILQRPVKIVFQSEMYYSQVFFPYITPEKVMTYQKKMQALCQERGIIYLSFEAVLRDGKILQEYLQEEVQNVEKFVPYIQNECGVLEQQAKKIAEQYCQMKQFINKNVDSNKIRRYLWRHKSTSFKHSWKLL